jgi:hypothetical protein
MDFMSISCWLMNASWVNAGALKQGIAMTVPDLFLSIKTRGYTVCVERDGVFRLFRRRIRRLSATDPGGICQAIVLIKLFCHRLATWRSNHEKNEASLP